MQYNPQATALRSFARLLGIPEAVAIAAYERELQSLTATAKVKNFVVIIAEKRAKEALASQGHIGR